MAEISNIHIGSIIKQKFEESAMTPSDFADKICCDRTTLYNIFQRKSIDTERLLRISKVLNFDFYNEIYLNRYSDFFAKKVLVAIEIPEENLKNMDLPKPFLRLVLQND
ncbi:MAG: helix-turn-helix domain-containing protein [Dysgonamonadaceae bacterium]|jgi:plasmid maintenance system antidote protein VapI|nr:helix-turn-helix domain-containing protein [Dysgonamonadaceae bacterium]